MSLTYQWDTFFSCEFIKKEFKRKIKDQKWTWKKGCIFTEVSMKMTVEPSDYPLIIQGFENKPTIEDLKILEKEMRKKLQQWLIQKKEYLIKEYNSKIILCNKETKNQKIDLN